MGAYKSNCLALVLLAASANLWAQTLSTGAEDGIVEVMPLCYIDVDVMPYYQSARSAQGQPTVKVHVDYDSRLRSNKREDIIAVRDAIQRYPQVITPMTPMVLAIRLYDVGLRDDAVFWFYAAENRNFVLSQVLNVQSPMLSLVEHSVRDFSNRAGLYFNNYAFCDPLKQHEARSKAIEWVEKNPYSIMFAPQLPALPGSREENIANAIAEIKWRAKKEQDYFAIPKNMDAFNKKRKEMFIPEQSCRGTGGQGAEVLVNRLEIGNPEASADITNKLAEQDRLLKLARQQLDSFAPLPEEREGESNEIAKERARRIRLGQVVNRTELQAKEWARNEAASPPNRAMWVKYYDDFADRIIAAAAKDFPVQDGTPVYGRLVLEIKLASDGQLEDVQVVRSASEILSRHSLQLVRSLAPYEPLPTELREGTDQVVITAPFTYKLGEK